MICQLISIITASQVDAMRFNQAEITRNQFSKLSVINNHFHLQTVTNMSLKHS